MHVSVCPEKDITLATYSHPNLTGILVPPMIGESKSEKVILGKSVHDVCELCLVHSHGMGTSSEPGRV